MECYKSQRGVQSLEVIISITLFAIIIVSIFVLFGSSITESGGLLKQARANTLVLEGLEGVRFLSANDWSALEVGQHGLVYGEGSWTFSGDTDVTDDVFFRTVSIEEIDSDTKDVVIEVYWEYQHFPSPRFERDPSSVGEKRVALHMLVAPTFVGKVRGNGCLYIEIVGTTPSFVILSATKLRRM